MSGTNGGQISKKVSGSSLLIDVNLMKQRIKSQWHTYAKGRRTLPRILQRSWTDYRRRGAYRLYTSPDKTPAESHRYSQDNLKILRYMIGKNCVIIKNS